MRHGAWVVALLAIAAPSAAQTPVTSFSFVSQNGDWVGQGQTRSYGPADGTFTAQKNYHNGVNVLLTLSGMSWTVAVAGPDAAPLAPGHYPMAMRFPFEDPGTPGLDVAGDGRGCNRLDGEFTVLDVAYGPGDTVISFAADFEQQCEGAAAAMFGSIRYNYVPPPFTVSPRAFAVGAGARALPLTIVATPPTGTWTAVSNDPWLTVPPSGNSGVFDVQVARNPTTSPRSGTVTVAGQTITVDQRGNGVPGAPGRPAASVTAGLGHFAWLPSDAVSGGDATRYRLEVGLSGGAADYVFSTPNATHDIAGVPPGRFYFRVRGTNEFGMGPASEELALVVSPTGDTLPEAPRDLTVVTALSRPTFSWSPPLTGGAGATYRLEAGSSSGTSDRAVVNLGTATTLAAGVVPAGVYFVRVRAVTAAGVSAPSNEVLLRIGALTAPPGPPVLTGAVAASTVTLTWAASTAGDAATRYRVEAGLDPGATALVQTLLSPATSVSFPGVPPGHYYVRVRGINARGTGPASNEIQIVVP